MNFQIIEVLYLLIPVVLLYFLVSNSKVSIEHLFAPDVLKKISINSNCGFSPKTRLLLSLMAMIMMIISLARPILPMTDIKIERQFSNLVVAIDLSKSMLVDDVYPSRFEFMKNKLINNLKWIKNTRIAILGFTTQSFLIAPLTDDYSSLKFLIKNLHLDTISSKGTNILGALKASSDLFEKTSNKQILLLTDGADNTDFTQEINYANKFNLKVFIFDISSKDGGVIKDENGILKDSNNDIVIIKENLNIRQLSAKTGGKYLKYSFKNNDLSKFINSINNKSIKRKSTIKQSQELFYYSLIITLILLFACFFSFPRKLS